MRPGPNGAGLSRKAIFDEIDNSLRRLGTDYVDLYQIHRWDYGTPIEETLEALHDVVKAGKARYIGASSMYAWQFSKALYRRANDGWTAFVTMQNHLNLLYREEEREMLPLCKDEGIGVIPWSPLARGRLTRDWNETPSASRPTTSAAALRGIARCGSRGDRSGGSRRGGTRRAARAGRARVGRAKGHGDAPIVGASKPASSDRCGRGAFAESVGGGDRAARSAVCTACDRRISIVRWLKRRSITITLWCGKESLIVPDARMALSLPCAAFPRR